ncbi:MAG: 4-hydroxy-3-methylbut-2-enyl diphosphate reductase [Candidatus Shapirobacteria bacterium]|nr:4-hydroxy-3-methylbut-2-enyl diphosphate reductase [Candidatus Shapirobacteria bacterium]MDD4410115.1 4-hydroxy-3-methylbut-2-enyl diphosphate reductase [Candidatus Shapirobacteria bacterium]
MANLFIASPHGFCFGINRAIDLARETREKYSEDIYFLGELVHNQHVVDWLESELKIRTVQSIDQIPRGSVVIIRAHGAPPQTYNQAVAKGLTIVDASCPLVLKSHQTVSKFSSQNKKIIFLCNSITHDETIGVVGENPYLVTPVVISDISTLDIPDPQNCIVMTQTTLSTLETKDALDFLKNKYPQITIMPHICQATSDRQNAIIELVKTCTLVIIVGSSTSANSNSLQKVAESVGVKSFIIDNASEINYKWFAGHQNIAISSGASTPESILEEVVQKINEIIHQ